MNVNKDNIINSLARVHIVKRVASKTGNDYYMLVLTFKSGYEFEAYMNKDQAFLVDNAVTTSGVTDALSDN